MYIPCQCCPGLILSRKEGYVESYGIILRILALSSKIIYATPSKGTDEEVDEENGEDDYEEGTGNKEWADDEEEIDKDEEESATKKGEDFAQGMNSLPLMNNHIQFSSTSSCTPSIDINVQYSATPLFMEITRRIIQDESACPSP
ncbi:unnamed protein product [Lactuca saligna]|uniref:Uncharacterized protein n=1 Tax=Lactuca saligna TaxID=75948 RepID=A0AA36EPV1_LACSI|nr:unnamed protein product [Lactuca saligna]